MPSQACTNTAHTGHYRTTGQLVMHGKLHQFKHNTALKSTALLCSAKSTDVLSKRAPRVELRNVLRWRTCIEALQKPLSCYATLRSINIRNTLSGVHEASRPTRSADIWYEAWASRTVRDVFSAPCTAVCIHCMHHSQYALAIYWPQCGAKPGIFQCGALTPRLLGTHCSTAMHAASPCTAQSTAH